MRDEDFRQSYVLNVKIVDSLLSGRSLYVDQIQRLFQLISTEFERCEDFFDAYYAGGCDVAGLLSGLTGAWKGLVPTAIASPQNISHVTQLIRDLPESSLKKLSSDFPALSEFVSDIQSAHQSLFTDVFRSRSHQWTLYNPSPEPTGSLVRQNH
jgi:hypothetical protein